VGADHLRSGAQWAFGDDASSNKIPARFRSKTTLEAIGGPTVGLVENLVDTSVTGFNLTFDRDAKFRRSDFNSARSLVPFQNAPIVRQIINEGRDAYGSAYDWPEIG